MSSKSTLYANSLLGLIFNAVDIPGLAGPAAMPSPYLYMSLHTAPLSPADGQSAWETTYPPYSRVALPRSPAAFTLVGNTITLAAIVPFAEATAIGPLLTHFAIGVAPAGPGMVLYSGPLTEPIQIAVGVMPRLTPVSFVVET